MQFTVTYTIFSTKTLHDAIMRTLQRKNWFQSMCWSINGYSKLSMTRTVTCSWRRKMKAASANSFAPPSDRLNCPSQSFTNGTKPPNLFQIFWNMRNSSSPTSSLSTSLHLPTCSSGSQETPLTSQLHCVRSLSESVTMLMQFMGLRQNTSQRKMRVRWSAPLT